MVIIPCTIQGTPAYPNSVAGFRQDNTGTQGKMEDLNTLLDRLGSAWERRTESKQHLLQLHIKYGQKITNGEIMLPNPDKYNYDMVQLGRMLVDGDPLFATTPKIVRDDELILSDLWKQSISNWDEEIARIKEDITNRFVSK